MMKDKSYFGITPANIKSNTIRKASKQQSNIEGGCLLIEDLQTYFEKLILTGLDARGTY